MPKTLVIAEKPSVANDLAKALGKFTKKDDFFESDDTVITSAIGHLVELCLPNEMDKKRGKWSFANLPIVPDHFDLKAKEKTLSRFNLIKRLLKRADIGDVVNACDAGREGELIFHYVIQLAGSKKPTRRLWLQSMTPEAIREGFAHLRAGKEMVPLTDAAVCRSESDWLVGINATRAMTAFNSRDGGFFFVPGVAPAGDSEARAKHGHARGGGAGVGEQLDIAARAASEDLAEGVESPREGGGFSREHVVENQIRRGGGAEVFQKAALEKFPRKTRVFLGLPAAVFKNCGGAAVAQVGKAVVVFESESERVEVVLETNEVHRTHGGGFRERLETLDRRHGVGGGTEADIPDYKQVGGFLAEALGELGLLDVELAGLDHRLGA